MTLLKGGKNMGKTLLAIPSAGEPIPSEEKTKTEGIQNQRNTQPWRSCRSTEGSTSEKFDKGGSAE